MTLWIGNGAVLKSSSQWQLKEVSKLNKRTMMVLYRSPEYLTVQVNNESKYQIDY